MLNPFRIFSLKWMESQKEFPSKYHFLSLVYLFFGWSICMVISRIFSLLFFGVPWEANQAKGNEIFLVDLVVVVRFLVLIWIGLIAKLKFLHFYLTYMPAIEMRAIFISWLTYFAAIFVLKRFSLETGVWLWIAPPILFYIFMSAKYVKHVYRGI